MRETCQNFINYELDIWDLRILLSGWYWCQPTPLSNEYWGSLMTKQLRVRVEDPPS